MKKIFYVYSHSLDGKIFYIGSNCGTNNKHNPNRAWERSYRNDKYKNYVGDRLNEIEVNILEWLPIRTTSGECQRREIEWIHYYHDLGLAECSGQDHRGEKNGNYGKGYLQSGEKNHMFGVTPTNARLCIIYKDGVEIGKFNSVMSATKYLESKIGGNLIVGIRKILNGSWVPGKRSQLYGYSIKYDIDN
ncbi:hypothetical protein AB1282_04640 [Gottfriedia sp. S16(2024)]|uniref:hypothetical protein n=1 Tax=Gottfriedia sp. S16(2024) TaxID=3162883 RepID=UPI003D1D4B73